MNLLDAHFEVKDITESGTFAGYGSVYGNVDDGNDVVSAGAFAESLGAWGSKGQMPALLWQHRSSEPIGAYTKMADQSNGLYVEGKLALKTQRGAEAYELMKMGALSGLSVGFMTKSDAYDTKTGIRTIKSADLYEVSLVTFPMNAQARVGIVKSIEEITDFKTAERYLRDFGGFSRSESTALVVRMKNLTLRNAADEDEAKQLIAALCRQTSILTKGN